MRDKMGAHVQLLENLDALVCEELKVVSFKWMSRAFSIPSNAAKQLLYAYTEQKGDAVKAVYLVSGWTQGESEGSHRAYHVQLATKEKINEVAAQLQDATVHVYSVQAALPKDPADLWSSDFLQSQELFNRPAEEENCLRDNRFSAVQYPSVVRTIGRRKRAAPPPPPQPAAAKPLPAQPAPSKAQPAEGEVGPGEAVPEGGAARGKGTAGEGGRGAQKKGAPLLSKGVSLSRLWQTGGGKPKAQPKPAEAQPPAAGKGSCGGGLPLDAEARIREQEANEESSGDEAAGAGPGPMDVDEWGEEEEEFVGARRGGHMAKRRRQLIADEDEEGDDEPALPPQKKGGGKGGEGEDLWEELKGKESVELEVEGERKRDDEVKASKPAADTGGAAGGPKSTRRKQVVRTTYDAKGREVNELVWEDELSKPKEVPEEKRDERAAAPTEAPQVQPPERPSAPKQAAQAKKPPPASKKTATKASKKGPAQGNITSFFKKA